jgi:aspartyl-tRNA(Asn)/glutamyl-tRNA(Gln) amidotransferase subunit B
MVTGPDLRSADEAAQYLMRLRQLLRWLGVSDADMEKGQLRCDANVSIRLKGEEILNPKTEIKNVNSIENVREAIEKEIQRQIREVEAGRKIQAWTLEWDEEAGVLRKMRSKETEADYRYFREPDLLPIRLEESWKNGILARVPELPLERRKRFVDQYGVPEYDADILTSERNLSDYFETAVKAFGGDPPPAGTAGVAKKVSNYLMNDVLRMLNDAGKTADTLRLTPVYLAEILKLVEAGTINTSTGKSLLQKVEESGQSPRAIVETEGLAKVSDDAAIRAVCQEVIDESPKEVESYRAGKVTLIGWFVGQVMKKMRGKADPSLARSILEDLLR